VESARLLDSSTRAAAALLSHGPRAVIAGPTAARLHDCTAIESATTHIVVPYEHPSRSRDGLTVHNGPLPNDDVVQLSGLRVLSLARVVSDLLCTARPRDSLAVADQALAAHAEEHREVFRADVARRMAGRADPRGTKSGARLLELATGRAESPPESWLMLEVVELGFSPPEANWPIYSPTGELVYRLDLAWPSLRIAIEYNGYAVHLGRENQDALRADDLRRRGWIVITVTVEDLCDNQRLCQLLREAFQRRGHHQSEARSA
jgi:hypothetical protein